MLPPRRRRGQAYNPPLCLASLPTAVDVELSDDMFIVQGATAQAYVEGKVKPSTGPVAQPPQPPVEGPSGTHKLVPGAAPIPVGVSRVGWQGDVPPQKWMNFYTKVLSKFVTQGGLKIGLNVEIAPEGGVSNQKVDEIRQDPPLKEESRTSILYLFFMRMPARSLPCRNHHIKALKAPFYANAPRIPHFTRARGVQSLPND
jgi:hypothetical protein